MDPITVSCFAFIVTISKASYSLLDFVQEFRGAKGDLEVISRELESTQEVLERLLQDIAEPNESALPSHLKQQISGILKSCTIFIRDYEIKLKKHSQPMLGKAGYWTIGGG